MNVWTIEWFILAYFIVSMTWNYAQMVLARGQLKLRKELPDPKMWPSVSVLIPTYNEERVIIDSIESMLSVDYPGQLDVCVCDDGSTDDTFPLLVNKYELVRDSKNSNLFISERVKIVCRTNGGRAAALNSALTIASGEYIVATDADTLLDKKGLRKIIKEMAADRALEAVGGTIMLANNIERRTDGTVVGTVPPKPITGTQAVEYLRAFLYGRLGLNRLGGNVIISGAFGVFRRNTLNNIGGWNENTVAEDFDLTIRLREIGGKALFIPDPVAWTEAPETLKSLGRQRERWHRGLSQIMFGPARRMYFRPKYGMMGTVVLPMYFLTEWMAPLVEILGVILIGSHIAFFNFGLLSAGIVFSLAFLIGVGLSVISIWFEQSNYRRYVGIADTYRLVKYSLMEPFWYRPLTLYWRLKGLVNYLRGKKAYGEMTRKGFSKVTLILVVLGSFGVASSKNLEAQTWVEAESYVEVGEVSSRIDVATRLKAGPFFGGALRRERNNISDVQIFVSGYITDLEPFVLSAGYAVAVTGDIFPQTEINWDIGVIAGHFVTNIGAKWQSFNQAELDVATLALYKVGTEYYTGNWRLAARGMVGDKANIFSLAGFVSHYYNRWNWTIYGSSGNELLDVPRIVGFVSEAGAVTRVRVTDAFELSGVLAYGKRVRKAYILSSLGLRMYF